MTWGKNIPLTLAVIVIGVFSVIPNSFGGVPTELCFDETGVEVSCDDPSCAIARIGECRIPDDDQDGISNEEDNCPFISNPNQADTDENGIGDACQDVDGDEVIDTEDNCPFISNPNQEDSDGDLVGDVCDNAPNVPNSGQEDVDIDGVGDVADNCVNDANLGQEDTDGNGIGDACQDVDGDEVLDTEDNCPFISNPNQADTDENGIGDACQEQTKLVVDATFPPGHTIRVALPKIPNVDTFSMSLKLPNTQGGNVVIETTDAGDTAGNFSFLGQIIDLHAPCSDMCEISFTFTQATLDAQGLTLDQVTIFHDMNENGSFEDNESVPTVITGTDPYTATASASFTSKFSLGGIKALALGALVGGGGGSQGGSPPSLKSISLDSIVIDEISSVNNFPTQTLETGVPFTLRLPFYEDNGASAIEHVAIYVLHGGYKVNDSELYLVYDKFKPTQIFDPHGYVSDFDVNIEEKSSHLADIVFGVTFAKSMEPSDIIVRAWDNYRRSADYKFNQVIKVESSGDFDDTEVISLDNTRNDNLLEVSETSDLAIPAWIKFNADWWSQDKIGDDDFIAGIKFLIEEDVLVIPESLQDQDEQVTEIPAWIKSSAGWWSQDLLSDKEFVQAIQWLIEQGIIYS